jgi:hypothetical protein
VTGSGFFFTLENDMQPIELRVNKAVQHGETYYTVDKVWPGLGNVSFGQLKFMYYRDARKWAEVEWPGIPLIRSW